MRSGDKYLCVIPELKYGGEGNQHRGDVVALHKNGMLTEIEVKTSWQDYCIDKRKQHISKFEKGKYTPNYFLYASHDISLCKRIALDLKNTKYGVRHIGFSMKAMNHLVDYLTSMQVHSYLLKQPKLLHNDVWREYFIKEFCNKASKRIMNYYLKVYYKYESS